MRAAEVTQVFRSSWIGDYGDPSTFFDCFTSEDGNNRTGWKNAAYDALAEKARMTGAFLERKVAEYEALSAEIDRLEAEIREAREEDLRLGQEAAGPDQ